MKILDVIYVVVASPEATLYIIYSVASGEATTT